MPIHDIQSSFAAGEVAPDLQSRTDIAKYKTALKTCRNMIPGAHGAVYNRPGTKYVATTKDSTKASRLLPFVFSDAQAYVLEVGNLYVRFYKDGAQILDTGVAYEVATPYLEADLFELKITQSADVLYITHAEYAPRTLTRTADASWALALYPFKNGPFMFPNTDTALHMTFAGSGTLTSDFDFFVAGHAGAHFRLTKSVDTAVLTGTRTSVGTFSYAAESPSGSGSTGIVYTKIECGGPWRFATRGTWVGKVSLQKSYDGGSSWKSIRLFVSNGDVNYDTFGTEDMTDQNESFLIRAVLFAYTSGTVSVDMTAEAFTISTTVVTTAFVDNRTMTTEAANWSDYGIAATSEWAEGSWSTYRGWPSTCSFFQDRLGFAATPTEPQTTWLTKTSNYVDFGRNSPLIDSDGITINLTGRRVNAIKSLTSFLQSCLAFTGSSEWTIGADSGGALAPATAFAKLQGNRGIGAIDPIFIGNRIIFIDPLGSAVRDLMYQYFTDSFDSENISTLSDHLFKGYTIVDAAYQQEPDSLLWMVRSDGTLLCLTYLREQEVIGWSRHDSGTGLFESACAIPGTDGDEVWFIVKRGSHRFIERMLPRTTSTDPADQYFVDCGISYSGAAASTLSGYSHLDGFTVAINAEGFVLPQQVVSGGNVTLDAARSKAHVGLPYVCDVEMLNPEVPVQGGTFQGRKYQINRAVFRFLNTVGGYVGSDFTTLDELDMRDESLAATTPTPLFTGYLTPSIPPSDDERGHVCFRQVDPMPVTILAIMPLINGGENV